LKEEVVKRATHLALIAIDVAICGALLTGCSGGGDDGEGIPRFQDVGHACTERLVAVIAGRSSIDAAPENCQEIASRVTGRR
jgi:hypothetical protein